MRRFCAGEKRLTEEEVVPFIQQQSAPRKFIQTIQPEGAGAESPHS
jgi:hypothetical protein